jgi:hypothetical protein
MTTGPEERSSPARATGALPRRKRARTSSKLARLRRADGAQALPPAVPQSASRPKRFPIVRPRALRALQRAGAPVGPARGWCQPTYKPGSVWRVAPPRRPFIWGAACAAPRATNPGGGRDRAWSARRARRAEHSAPPLFGLAPGGVYRAASVAGGAVRSYRTVSPLPLRVAPRGRSHFCGTFPGVTPGGR